MRKKLFLISPYYAPIIVISNSHKQDVKDTVNIITALFFLLYNVDFMLLKIIIYFARYSKQQNFCLLCSLNVFIRIDFKMYTLPVITSIRIENTFVFAYYCPK